jgi:hypothetical protein
MIDFDKSKMTNDRTNMTNDNPKMTNDNPGIVIEQKRKGVS